MRHSFAWKAVALILCACALTAAVAGGFGVTMMAGSSMYSQTLEEKQEQWLYDIGNQIAYAFAYEHAARELGGCTEDIVQWLNPGYSYAREDEELWHAAVTDGNRVVSQTGQKTANSYAISYMVSVHYPRISEEKPADYDQTITMMVDGVNKTVYVTYQESPLLNVVVSMEPEILSRQYLLLTKMYPYRNHFLALGLTGVVLFGLLLGLLCWCAGVGKAGKTAPGGLNRMPLDVYFVVVGAGIWGLVVLLIALYDWLVAGGHPSLLLASMTAVTFGGALAVVGFLFALAAQLRAGGRWLWQRMALGFCLGKLWKGLKFAGRGIRAVFTLLPVIWQWLVCFGVLLSATVASCLLLLLGGGQVLWVILLILCLLADIATVLYTGFCVGRLMEGARRMAQGDLSYQVSTRYLAGCFRTFAQQLNSLSETAMVSAQKQMKSERMKTELITNVSHDIKTPLTSIINFVDLLQKPHTPQQEQEYLQILSRQSGRMKKLIEDLMELSKASTGNLTVNLCCMDAGEAVHQALGEFSDKLAAAELTPVYHQPEGKVLIEADGRLVWRVLSNLLSNAVKYAMPGTRLYLDLARVDSWVMLSVKNISREELRVSAEELMERFVRGDTSRNAEGSGLGLNIAKSLMEVQGGQLQLLVDGDLFKVTLIFPAV